MPKETPDIPVSDLLALIDKLPAEQFLTDIFENPDDDEEVREVWYEHQKEHLQGWLSQYNSPGAYNRANPSTSSKKFYNNFKAVTGLLWLAEALGEDRDILANAILDAVDAGDSLASQCGAFRRRVPWIRIHQLVTSYPPSATPNEELSDATLARFEKLEQGV